MTVLVIGIILQFWNDTFFKISGSTSTLNGTTKYPRKSKHLYHHWHRSVSDMRNVAKILSIVSARCESTSACSLCADFSSNVASVDAIPCILVSALQTYHRLTVDVTHFLASTNPRLSRNSTFCNLQDIDSEQDEERPLTTVSIICLHSKYIHTVFYLHSFVSLQNKQFKIQI